MEALVLYFVKIETVRCGLQNARDMMMARQVRHQKKVSFDDFYNSVDISLAWPDSWILSRAACALKRVGYARLIHKIDLDPYMYILSKLWVGMNSGPICIFCVL